jgi:anti-sigma factor RsiW
MICREARELMHGYVDGELDLVRNLEMERHFHECGLCAGMHEKLRGMRLAMSGSLPYFEAPAGLENRIRSRLRAVTHGERGARRLGAQWQWAGIAAALALAVAGAWGVTRIDRSSGAAEVLTQEAVASHVRSLMAAHLTDVPSSDRHTVKPWFNGKLDFSPVVGDFADRGFPLTGGRLDYLDHRPVAALVYQRRKHVINLFIWPVPEQADSGVETVSRQGYHVLHWTRGHMVYWAVSDLNAAELGELAGLVRKVE